MRAPGMQQRHLHTFGFPHVNACLQLLETLLETTAVLEFFQYFHWLAFVRTALAHYILYLHLLAVLTD